MKLIIKKHSWVLAPLVSIALGVILYLCGIIVINEKDSQNVISNAITAAGIIASVLITNYTIILALPEDKAAIKLFRNHKYFRVLTKHIAIGTLMFLITLVASLTVIPPIIILIPFMAGIGNLVGSGYILYNVLLSIS